MAKFITVMRLDGVKHYLNIDAIIEVKWFPKSNETYIYTTGTSDGGSSNFIKVAEKYEDVVALIEKA